MRQCYTNYVFINASSFFVFVTFTLCWFTRKIGLAILNWEKNTVATRNNPVLCAKPWRAELLRICFGRDNLLLLHFQLQPTFDQNKEVNVSVIWMFLSNACQQWPVSWRTKYWTPPPLPYPEFLLPLGHHDYFIAAKDSLQYLAISISSL